jgi:peptide deformylase
MELIKGNDPSLFYEAKDFDFDLNTDHYVMIKNILSFMILNNHLSLCGNQIGYNYKMIIIRADPNLVFFNPTITYESDEYVSLQEACPNIPGLSVTVNRPKSIRLRYQVPSGEIESKTFEGLTARLIQHHLDFISGIRYYNRAGLYHRDKIKKFLKNMK